MLEGKHGVWDNSKFAQDYLKVTSDSEGKTSDPDPHTSIWGLQICRVHLNGALLGAGQERLGGYISLKTKFAVLMQAHWGKVKSVLPTQNAYI